MNRSIENETSVHVQSTFNILIVDDEQSMLDTYTSVLNFRNGGDDGNEKMVSLEERLFGSSTAPKPSPFEFRLTCCNQGDEAVRMVSKAAAGDDEDRFAVAFVDVRMPPGPDGVWTAGWIRTLSPETHIVIVTAYSDIDPVDIAQRIPPMDKLFYVQKPFHAKELRQFTGALCSRWLAERHLQHSYSRLELDVEQHSHDLARTREFLKMEQMGRTQAEIELSEARNLMEHAFENLSDALFVVDPVRPAIVMCNCAAGRIFGYPKKNLIGQNPAILYPDVDTFQQFFASVFRHLEQEGAFRGELRMKKRNGELFVCEHSVAEIRGKTGMRTAIVSIVRDVTVQRQMERKAGEIEEEERKRIGQDLHDDIGQLLTGLAFKSGSLEKSLEKNAPNDLPVASEITRLAHEAINKVRLIAKGMTPLVLSGTDLRAAFDELVQSLRTIFDVEISCEIEGDVRIGDPHIVTNFYRIAQEAATNAVRHGDSAEIHIAVRRKGNGIRLEIIDNGRKPRGARTESTGIGTHIMRQRASLIGGTFEMAASETGGMIVSCSVPTGIRESGHPGPGARTDGEPSMDGERVPVARDRQNEREEN